MEVSESMVVMMITSLEGIYINLLFYINNLYPLLVHILVEIIKGGVHHQGAEADGQREEHLGDGRIPHMGIQQLRPLGFQEVNYAPPGSWQSHSPDQQDKHNHIGKQGQEVGGFA